MKKNRKYRGKTDMKSLTNAAIRVLLKKGFESSDICGLLGVGTMNVAAVKANITRGS